MEKRGVKKRTKSPTVAELSRLKRELQRVTEQLESRERELSEVLEQQTATTEILRVIASSPTDLQPVLDVVAENAARLCEATDALIRRVEADILRLVASYGPLPTSQTRPISRQVVSGRAVIDRQTIHVHDIAVAEDEFPDTRTRGIPEGVRTFLATPLLCKGVPIGTIVIRRMEARPFSDKQIKLLETFADQAVIAIENVRLFKELQERNRDLTEALEQQTATGEVLRVIASSPTELQPVLDTVIANAVKLIGAEHGHIRQYDGELLQVVAYCNVGAEGVTALARAPSSARSRNCARTRVPGEKTHPYPKPRTGTRIGSRIYAPAVSGRHHPCRSHASQGGTHWDALDLAGERHAIYRAADRACNDLCRPGRDRHRERAPVPRTASPQP